MPVTQDRLTRLREFGLSEYAARSYLALLDLGIAEARDVSSISKVPQAKIYHVLEQLHDKGLVVILPEFPKKYAPVPFEEYITRIYEEHTKAARTIEDQRAELAEMFRVMGDTDVGDRGFFTVIRGRRNVLAKVEEMIAQTSKDLVILGTAGTASRATHMLAALRRARERDVRVRVLAPVDTETIERLAPLAELSDLRARELSEAEQSAKVAIVVSDSSRAFLIHFVPDDANLYSGKDIGVFTDQEAMVAAIQAIVEPHWGRATRYETRRDEILHGRSPAFTRIYTDIADAFAAFEQAFRGAGEVCAVNAGGLVPERLRPLAGRFRAIEDLADASAIDAWASSAPARTELRHLRTSAITRQVTVDAREAFFSIARVAAGGGRSEVVLHTNAPAVVAALRAHFDSLWSAAIPHEDRRRELEMFPDLQPRDVGFGSLFHVLRDGVLVADGRERILMWNPAATAIFGRDDVRLLHLDELLAAEARPLLYEAIARLRRSHERESVFLEVEALRGGERFPVELTLSQLSVAKRERCLVVVARDITARRKAQDAQEQAVTDAKQAGESLRRAASFLTATLDATVDGVLVISGEGRMIGHNRQFREMWDLPDNVMAEGDDARAVAFVADQLVDPDGFTRKIRELYASPEAESHDVLRFKDGRVFERFSKALRVDGEPVGRVWTFRDVSPRGRPRAAMAPWISEAGAAARGTSP